MINPPQLPLKSNISSVDNTDVNVIGASDVPSAKIFAPLSTTNAGANPNPSSSLE